MYIHTHMCVYTQDEFIREKEKEWILTELHTFFSPSLAFDERRMRRGTLSRKNPLISSMPNQQNENLLLPIAFEPWRREEITINSSPTRQRIQYESRFVYREMSHLSSFTVNQKKKQQQQRVCVYTCRRWWWWMSRWRRSGPSQGETILNKVARAERSVG